MVISSGAAAVCVWSNQWNKHMEHTIPQDLEDTVGSWDMYGSDVDKQRYNGLQSEFFSRATQPLSRRSSLLAFTAGGMYRGGLCTHSHPHNSFPHTSPSHTTVGALSLLVWGAKGSKDANLPITVGPKVC